MAKTTDTYNAQTHWDAAYTGTATQQLGWYEAAANPTLALLAKTKLPKNARQLHVGAGSSKLIDSLVSLDYTELIVNDISAISMQTLQERLGAKATDITFVVDDLLQADKLQELPPVALWNDRAVAHFFTSEADQQTYFNLVRKLVAIDGFVIIAAFDLEEGATKCCGLPVFRYTTEMLQERLGNAFKLVTDFKHTFTNPNGDARPYIYTLFQRTSAV